MAVLSSIGAVVYILIFFVSVIFSLKFQFGAESNDERGKKILNTSYGFAFPLVISGWFIIYLIEKFVAPFSLDSYQTAIWFLVTGTYIVHAVTLFSLRKLS